MNEDEVGPELDPKDLLLLLLLFLILLLLLLLLLLLFVKVLTDPEFEQFRDSRGSPIDWLSWLKLVKLSLIEGLEDWFGKGKSLFKDWFKLFDASEDIKGWLPFKLALDSVKLSFEVNNDLLTQFTSHFGVWRSFKQFETEFDNELVLVKRYSSSSEDCLIEANLGLHSSSFDNKFVSRLFWSMQGESLLLEWDNLVSNLLLAWLNVWLSLWSALSSVSSVLARQQLWLSSASVVSSLSLQSLLLFNFLEDDIWDGQSSVDSRRLLFESEEEEKEESDDFFTKDDLDPIVVLSSMDTSLSQQSDKLFSKVELESQELVNEDVDDETEVDSLFRELETVLNEFGDLHDSKVNLSKDDRRLDDMQFDFDR